jgi:hypothetical protein
LCIIQVYPILLFCFLHLHSNYLFYICALQGSDNDNVDTTAPDISNENSLVSKGLNRYRLEWPLEWAADINGDYTASILPKANNLEAIGEYQVCFANTWGSYSFADVSGTVSLVGMQSCAALVCAPGDRAYCSEQGEGGAVLVVVLVLVMMVFIWWLRIYN